MAPTKFADKNPLRNLTNAIGHATRAKRGALKTQGENAITVAKRKAASPIRESAAKRAAFGDITNAVNKPPATRREKTVILKKVTVESKVLPSVKVVQQVKCDKVEVEKTTKLTNGTTLYDFDRKDIVRLESQLKPKDKPVDTKTRRSTSSKNGVRISDVSEASLYVSAIEDVTTDFKVTNSSGDDKTGEKDCLSQLNGIDKLTISGKPESRLPEGVVDFDKENWNDPFQVSNYAMDIFEYLKTRESKFLIKDYMPLQKDINSHMRALLVDWMVEVQEGFELNHETLYLAVKLVDLYLCRETIIRDELQLLGAASLLISAKFDERYPPLIEDFLYICDGAYTMKRLLAMEIKILKVIDFDLGIPISYRFLRRYARCARVSMPVLTLARFILELCLMEYAVAPMSDSKMAAAALYLAIKMKNLGTWTPTHVHYSGYSLKEIIPVAHVLNMCLHKKPKQALSTIRTKYTHKVFFGVAQVPLISNDCLND